jgi:hypothetical protein
MSTLTRNLGFTAMGCAAVCGAYWWAHHVVLTTTDRVWAGVQTKLQREGDWTDDERL